MADELTRIYLYINSVNYDKTVNILTFAPHF